ncbi:uncharacterized protein LY89DRAFT_683341, partial [Mollisia scopiformis]
MASPETPPKSLAFVHNTDLPHPLGVLSTAISAWIERVCIRPNILTNYNLVPFDLADYDLEPLNPSNELHGKIHDTSTSTPKKSLACWQEEITKHSAFILLFPYHTWSHCTPLKNALSPPLYPHPLRKPILLIGFGREEPSNTRTWKRKSFPMMKDFFREQGLKVIDVEIEQWIEGKMQLGVVDPEFTIYADYWEDWITGGTNAWLGGQQVEAFESRGWNRCQEGVMKMVDVLEGRAKTRKGREPWYIMGSLGRL